MKKFLAILVVLALTVISSIAFAEVTLSGAIDTRGQYYNNTAADADKGVDTGDVMRTQTRVRLEAAAKNADNTVRGKIQIENDWDTWGGTATTGQSFEKAMSRTGDLKLREAWLDFNLPGLPGHLKGGHQFLQLGQGWFFRSMKYGSDAWLLGFPGMMGGKNTLAFIDVKIAEYDPIYVDDIDAFVVLDTYKIDDNSTVGVDLTMMNDRGGSLLGGTDATLNNIGVNYTGKVGPVNLKAELDVQMGTATKGAGATDMDFSGNQIVLQANMKATEELTVNATIAMGSGDDSTTADANEGIQTFMDIDQHYTLIYEFNVGQPGSTGTKNFGFENTTAINVGANYAISKTLSVGADIWMLSMTEAPAGADSDLGLEIDARLVWKMYDALTLNWQVGMLQTGKAYDTATVTADDVTGSQIFLSYKF